MLLPSLHCHPQSSLAGRINTDSNDSPWHHPLVLLWCGQESCMRTSIAHWNSKPLSWSHNNICTQLPRRLQHSECQQITSHNNLHLMSMSLLDELPIVQHLTLSPRVLHKHTTHIPRFVINILKICCHNLQIKSSSPCLANINGLRVAVACNDEGLLLPLLDVIAHGHCLSCSCALIKQWSIGHGQASEVSYHGLVIQQWLKPPLRYLSLVRSVLSVPSRVLHYVPQDHWWNMSVVVPHPNVGLENLVLWGQLLHVLNHLALCQPSVEFPELHLLQPDRLRHSGIHQRIQTLKPTWLCHLALFLWGGRVMAPGESVTPLKRFHRDGSGWTDTKEATNNAAAWHGGDVHAPSQKGLCSGSSVSHRSGWNRGHAPGGRVQQHGGGGRVQYGFILLVLLCLWNQTLQNGAVRKPPSTFHECCYRERERERERENRGNSVFCWNLRFRSSEVVLFSLLWFHWSLWVRMGCKVLLMIIESFEGYIII